MSSSLTIARIGLLAELGESALGNKDEFKRAATRLSRIDGAAKVSALLSALDEAYIGQPSSPSEWALLEALVVYDEIQYDEYAFDRHEMSGQSRDTVKALSTNVLKPVRWPATVYKATHDRVCTWRKALRDSGREALARKVALDKAEPYSDSNDAFWSHADKHLHDGLATDIDVGGYSFANSKDTLERALFYVELASMVGIPLLPGASRYGSIMDFLGRSYAQCAHDLVKSKLRAFEEEVRPAELCALFPPLAEKVLRESLRRGLDPISVALELRETESAKRYRRFLAELQAELRKPLLTPARVKELTKDLDEACKQWTADGQPSEGVKYRTRRLKVQLLPAAASVAAWMLTGSFPASAATAAATAALQSAMGDAVILRDPVLWGGEKYLAFIADWFVDDAS